MVHWLEELARVKFSIKFKGNSLSFNQQLESLTEGYMEKRSKHFRILIIQFGIMALLRTLVIASSLILGAMLVINAELTVGQFIAAEIVIISLMGSIEKFIYEIDDIYGLLTALIKITDITSLEKEESGKIVLKSGLVKGFEIVGKDVNVIYPNSSFPVLENLNFHIKPGSIIGVFGTRDSGKSSFIRMLTGLVQTSGQLLINDHPLHTLNIEQFRSQIGIITNESALFEKDLRTNLTLGEAYTDEQINEMLEDLGLSDWVNNLPEWLDTVFGAEIHRLPASIGYRILLARLLLKKRALTIIDYIPIDLDSKTQECVMNSIMKYNHGKTLIFSANYQEAYEKCNSIILLKDRTISEVVPPDTFFAMQNKGRII